MNKRLFFSLVAAGLVSAGVMAAIGFSKPDMAAAEPPRPTTAAAADDGAVTFYGAMEQSTAWERNPEVAIYSFTDQGDPADFTPVTAKQTSRLVTGGGAYVDGYFYYLNGTSTYLNISNTFNKLDTDTWQVVRTSGHMSPTKTDAYAMAYDYSTATMYAFSEDKSAGQSYLRKVNLETGEFTDVAPMTGYYSAIAFDADGQLYGFLREEAFPHRASLARIDKNTGVATTVGELGYNQKSDYSAAVFDYRTGKLYWTSRCFTYNEHYEETYTSYLMEVNTSTGKATPVKTFNNSEVFAALFIKDSHPKAPEAAGNLKFIYSSSDNRGNITFSVPSRRYDRTTLTGQVKAEIYVDGTLVQTLTGLAAGSVASSKELDFADGLHKVRVFCYDAQGFKSVPADFNAWAGADVPAAVTGIQISVNERGNTATLSWKAPDAGKSGGNFDKDHMTYRIVRRPDNKTIATGLTTTTYTDTPDRQMLLSQYEIYAETPDGASDPAYSSPALVGAAYPMTYLETFDSATAFNSYTLIDVNGVGTPNGDRWMWYPDYHCAVYWLNYDARNAADAWLITPTLDLKDDNVYRFSFSTRGYSSAYSTYTLTAHAGPVPTQQGMKAEFMRVQDFAKKDWTSFSGLFLADGGDCRVGLHLTSSGEDHCGIDNVRVAYYGPSTIPAAPSLVSIDKNGTAARLTVTAPSKDAKGRGITSLTKISLYRQGVSNPVATVSAPQPGSEVVIEDKSPVFGDNNYIVTATNESGEGLEAAASISMRAPKPLPVENITLAVQGNGNDVLVSWKYPDGYPSSTDETLTADDITYDVYRQADGVRTPVARDLKATSITDADVMALFPGERQKRVSYYVAPKTSGGLAEERRADAIAGRAYEMPMAVSDFYDNPYSPWLSNPSTAWSPADRSWTPDATPYKGSSMMRCYDSGQYEQLWTSPRINLTGLSNPMLCFMMYCENSTAASASSMRIGIITDKDGVEQPLEILPDTYGCRQPENGWKRIEVNLSRYSRSTRASIVFIARATKDYMVLIDDIQVDGEKVDRDMRVTSIEGPANCVRGRENKYAAHIHNNGRQAIGSATVEFSVDGAVVETKTISAAVDEELTLDFNYVPELKNEDTTGTIAVRVTAEGDGNTENDYDSMRVAVIRPNVPYVDDLCGAYDSDTQEVTLTWSEAVKYPRAFPVKDDFESYDDFIIEGIGAWQMVDRDGAATIGGIQSSMGQFTWTNAGLPQAYIVFNPAQVGVQDLATAYSGDKCLVAFCAARTNDDWLISPALVGLEQEISFYARAMNAAYPAEKFEVLYSRTGTDITDFEELEKVSLTSDAWRKFTFTLPEGSRYFAIRCTSDNQFALMLDDIEYIPAQPSVNLLGYNIYRDDAPLAGPMGETEYIDRGIAIGEKHSYQVSALYEDGESIRSNNVVIEAAGIGAAASAGVKVASGPSLIKVIGADGLGISVATPDGRLLYDFTGTGADTLSVGPGIYIVRAGGITHKLIVN